MSSSPLAAASAHFRKDPNYNGRVKPMRLIVLGMARTGTMSQKAALSQLGFTVHHMMDFFPRADRDSPLWQEAYNSKFKRGKCSLTRKEWDMLLGDFDACIDLPSAAFVPELLEVYPDVKVVIAQRPADKWFVSWCATVGRTVDTTTRFFMMLDPSSWAWQNMIKAMHGVWGGTRYVNDKEVLIRRYNEIHDEARSVAPAGRTLEWQLADGWEPLCKFLEVPAPPKGTPFPHINDTAQFLARVDQMRSKAVKRAVTYTLGSLAITALASAATYYTYFRK